MAGASLARWSGRGTSCAVRGSLPLDGEASEYVPWLAEDESDPLGAELAPGLSSRFSIFMNARATFISSNWRSSNILVRTPMNIVSPWLARRPDNRSASYS